MCIPGLYLPINHSILTIAVDFKMYLLVGDMTTLKCNVFPFDSDFGRTTKIKIISDKNKSI